MQGGPPWWCEDWSFHEFDTELPAHVFEPVGGFVACITCAPTLNFGSCAAGEVTNRCDTESLTNVGQLPPGVGGHVAESECSQEIISQRGIATHCKKPRSCQSAGRKSWQRGWCAIPLTVWVTLRTRTVLFFGHFRHLLFPMASIANYLTFVNRGG